MLTHFRMPRKNPRIPDYENYSKIRRECNQYIAKCSLCCYDKYKIKVNEAKLSSPDPSEDDKSNNGFAKL